MGGGGESAIKFCPTCNRRVKTHVESGSQKNVIVHGLEAKRRKVICTVCQNEWHTVDVIESQLDDLLRRRN
jgi:hypothetical protein